MRLIDADNLKLGICKECTLYPDKCLKDNCDWDSIYHIKIEPTVEAIPLIFIAENMFKYIKRYGNVYLDIITELIDEWRKENE